MEQTLLEEDMIHYIWYKRSYCLVSSRNSAIHSSIEFCPFCGRDVSSDAVDEEYASAGIPSPLLHVSGQEGVHNRLHPRPFTDRERLMNDRRPPTDTAADRPPTPPGSF